MASVPSLSLPETLTNLAIVCQNDLIETTSQSDCLESDQNICRICQCEFSTYSQENLISACQCKGALGMVHCSCLEKWLGVSNRTQCEICRTPYDVVRTPRVSSVHMKRIIRSAFIDGISRPCPHSFLYKLNTNLSGRHQEMLDILWTWFQKSNIKEKLKPFRDWLRNPERACDRRNVLHDLVCFLVVLPMSLMTGCLCLIGVMHYLTFTKEMSAHFQLIGIVILTIILEIVFIVWIVTTIRYHCAVWKNWRSTHYEVHLRGNYQMVEPQGSNDANDVEIGRCGAILTEMLQI